MPLEIGEVPGGGRPWGDIYKVETPTLDRVAAQMQQQYAARQAFQQKESLNTEEVLNKELANVRSVDAPGVMDAVSQWKNLQKNVLFNRALQANPKAYNAAQMEANAAYGNAMGLINKSVNLNQFGKQLATDRATQGKSNLYADDFGDKAAAFWNTPMDKLQSTPQGDLSNLDTYRYRGMATNFGDLEKKAAGTPAQKYQKEEQISPLQKNITPYSFGNTPAQYQSILRGEYATNKQTNRDAAAAWEAIPQTEKDRVDQLYAQIPAEKWQQMGAQGPQAIAPTNAQDPADNLSAYKAKLYAINNNPSAGKVYSNVDQNAKLGVQFGQRAALEAIREGNREKLKTLGHTFHQMDIQQQSQVLDNTVGEVLSNAKSNGSEYIQTNPYDVGSITKQYKVDVSPEMKKALSIQDPEDVKHRLDASDVYYNEQNKTVTPVFYKPGQAHTPANIDWKYSKPMTFGEFKAVFGKTYFGVREAAKETTPATVRVKSGITWQ